MHFKVQILLAKLFRGVPALRLENGYAWHSNFQTSYTGYWSHLSSDAEPSCFHDWRHTSAVCVGGVLTLVKRPNPQKSAQEEGTCQVIRDGPQHKLHSITIKASGLRASLIINVHALGWTWMGGRGGVGTEKISARWWPVHFNSWILSKGQCFSKRSTTTFEDAAVNSVPQADLHHLQSTYM